MTDRRLLRPIPGVAMHRVPLRSDEVTEYDGLADTTMVRTAIDCVRVLPRRQATAFLDRALQQHWVSLADLDLEVARTSGRHGTPQLRVLRDACAEGDAESERLLHRVLRQAGIEGWRANAPVDVGFAILKFDVVFAALRLIVEVDGFATHTKRDRFTSDRTRQNAIEVRGWRILRFTWDHVANQPDYVIASVRQMIAAIQAT